MKNFIGIRTEDRHASDKRAPLIPVQVEKLINDYGIKVVVQPSSSRLFKGDTYRHVGAIISDDLSDCNVILGIKEISNHNLLPRKAYCFFSHTIKGQTYNMPMLKRILDLK